MVVKVTKPFKHLKAYRVVLVTGCQRSGTHIAAEMIAHDCAFKMVEERVFNAHHEATFKQIVANNDRIVIQCPAMMHMIHEVADDDVAIVVMHRDKQAVESSMLRIRWVERGEKQSNVKSMGLLKMQTFMRSSTHISIAANGNRFHMSMMWNTKACNSM